MNTEILFLIGRILFGGYFFWNGLNHLVFKTAGLAQYAAMKKVPSPKLAVLLSGLLILSGGLGVLLGMYIGWAVACLVLFLIPVTFAMHDFWNDADPMMKMGNVVNFMKNLALLGAALMLLMIPAPWPMSFAF